ncbi:component of SufBCD complex [Sedimentimonas flavescens]|uniref:Component of SufBCD complex n=1 Tax=Sedimentimonas flavescens TaxID=2851012 RepID=A0ABT2ZX32_9RHOB|nr:component of SufBCD complex [Sedimentimonas flavescens]MCV2878309.1 component of SufBCD complex [Sedimentimonas flavescens]
MKTIAAIRTNHWGEDAERVFAQLAPVWGDRLVTVFHNRPEGMALPLPVVDINDAWVEQNGLRVLPDWGWRCGDYCLYALRQAYPDAEHFWLIEPDVFFKGDVGAFFDRFADRDEDCLGVSIEELPAGNVSFKPIPGLTLFRSIFALVRFSGRAIEMLRIKRQEYFQTPVRPFRALNDECFCFSFLHASDGFSLGSMASIAPDLIQSATMRTDPDRLPESVPSSVPQGVFHPVRCHGSFRAAVSRRLAARGAPFGLLVHQLQYLEPWEIDELAREAAEHLKATMHQQRLQQIRKNQRRG